MGKTFDIADMPALTPEMQKKVGDLEVRLEAALQDHCQGYNIFDLEGAFEKARTFATVFYDCYYGFYSQFPAYKAHWRKASETFAFQRVLTWISSFHATREKFDAARLKRIKRTISNHAEPLPPARMPSPSALSPRGQTFPRQRIGRSIQSEKAARRMEAYIQHKGITQTQFSVAVQADQKTLYRFRRTGKVDKSVATRIAEAMGITLDQLTA